jgi:hypothetical protein
MCTHAHFAVMRNIALAAKVGDVHFNKLRDIPIIFDDKHFMVHGCTASFH